MKLFYTLLLYLMTPFIVLRLFWKSRANPAYRERWQERFGLFSDEGLKQTFWIHAVSVGEVQATQQLIKKLKVKHPDWRIVVSTTTPTGADRVEMLFGDDVSHYYFPYDLPHVLERWLEHVDPKALLMMETEIWPNLLHACHMRGIPTLLANARLSERSARGYARLGRFTRDVVRMIDFIAAQSEADAGRFKGLGMPADRITITGSVKFDSRQPAVVREKAEAVRRIIGADRPVWIAASTREGEEEAILAAHHKVCERMPGAMLILVPRHPERFDKVALLCEQRGFLVVRRSENRPCEPQHNIFLGDSMGELAVMYQASDLAFVGGSLVDAGGQNVLEPASLGLPVLFGPSMYNFATISELLLCEQAAIRIDDTVALSEQVVAWLSDASRRSFYGENGRRVVEANRGATERLIQLIDQLSIKS